MRGASFVATGVLRLNLVLLVWLGSLLAGRPVSPGDLRGTAPAKVHPAVPAPPR